MLVFVYGSLRRGEQYHFYLASARFVAAWQTAPEWRFWDLDSYPAMSPGGDVAVHGELFEIDADTLARLDVLEEVPELYQRTAIPTPWGDAWAYVVWEPPADATPIAGGIWTPG